MALFLDDHHPLSLPRLWRSILHDRNWLAAYPCMSALPPPVTTITKAEDDHLRLLAIFHFVGAGLAGIGLLFLFAHYSFMHLFFANPKLWEGQKGGPPPAEFFAIFQWFYLIFGIFLVAFAILNVFSGWFLLKRQHRTFSLVVAGLNCIHIPLGTALGVFTFVVLMRESVRQAYEANEQR